MADGPNMYLYCLNDPVNFVDMWGLCAEVGYSKIISIGDLIVWHTFIKITYNGQTKIRGFDNTNRMLLPLTFLGFNIPGRVKAEKGESALYQKLKITDSSQIMILYNIVDSKQFQWNSYNYAGINGGKNCYDWVDAVLFYSSIKHERGLPWSKH
jgi:hypothetical protein